MLRQHLQLNLGIEAALGFHHNFTQDARIIVPLPDALQVPAAALIVQDEGHDLMPQTFLEHD